MNLTSIIVWAVVGGLIGWAASSIMKTSGGLLRSIIIGIAGSFFGGWLAGLIGINVNSPFSFTGLAVSIAGACLLIFLGKKLFKD